MMKVRKPNFGVNGKADPGKGKKGVGGKNKWGWDPKRNMSQK